MRYRVVLGLAVLLMLSGCQTAPGPSDGGTPTTVGAGTGPVADDTTAASPTGPNATSFSYPAGASPDGLDPSLLPTTHHEALLNGQRYTFTQSQRMGNRTVTTRLHVDHGRQRVHGQRTFQASENRSTVDIYTSKDTVYTRQGRQLASGSFLGNYDERSQNWSSDVLTARSTLSAVLETYRFEPETAVTRNGDRLLRYQSTGPRERSNDRLAPLPANGTASLTVDERGIARSVVVRPSVEDERIELTVSDVGTADVVRPEWVDVAEGPPPVEVPTANLSANTSTVELQTPNETLETTAVWIHHDGGESMNASALDVTAGRARAYDLRNLSSGNETLRPVRPFGEVGQTFDPGESVRVVHTVPPRLYSGLVTIANGTLSPMGADGRSFPTLEDERSLRTGQQIRVLWNRSQPQVMLTYTAGNGTNRSVTTDN